MTRRATRILSRQYHRGIINLKFMPASKQKQILIIEDEKPMANALELKLTKAGFKTTIAYDGLEAERILKQKKFDLILLDLVLPKKDGFALLADSKRENDKTPIIVMTNLSQEEDKIRAKELGALDYIVKSDISLADVVQRIKDTIGA